MANRHDTYEGKPINQRKIRLLNEANAGGLSSEEQDQELKELLACCFSYIELIDEMVGEVVSTLKELDLYEDTAIIFTADHGDMAGSHGLMNKGAYMYDETYRIPLLLKRPGTEESITQRFFCAPDGRDGHVSAFDDGGGAGQFVGAEPSRAVAAAAGRGGGGVAAQHALRAVSRGPVGSLFLRAW